MAQQFNGVICAAVTPMHGLTIDHEAFAAHVRTLATEGCHGVLVAGTTGEGPSLGLSERPQLVKAAVSAANGMRVFAGTGCSSLTDTIAANRDAFDNGADAVVIVPPFYFRRASVDGLFDYYVAVIEQSVPADRSVMLYHIPPVSGVPITVPLAQRLYERFGDRICGVKDSGGDMAYTSALLETVPGLPVFVGSERVLLEGLMLGAAGCITAGANSAGAACVRVYEAWRSSDESAGELQAALSELREVLESYPPGPAAYKALLRLRYGGVSWDVRPPLENHGPDVVEAMVERITALDLDLLPWIAG